MTDIYHALINNQIRELETSQLIEYRDSCALAATSVTDALRLIGNLAQAATQNQSYASEDAMRDLSLVAKALKGLPYLASVLEKNSHQADFEFSRRVDK